MNPSYVGTIFLSHHKNGGEEKVAEGSPVSNGLERAIVVTVCIVNWNTRAYLEECLQSLRDFPMADGVTEVVVVDNASTDGSVEMVRGRFPDVKLVANEHNAGYAEGNNQALRLGTGDYLLLLNPDVVFKGDVLTPSVAFMEARPEAGALGCKLLSADGSIQRSVRSFPDPLPVLFEYLGLARIFPKSKVFGRYRMTFLDYDSVAEVDQPMGSYLLIRRKALDQVGLLDPDFPIFFNEVDWCFRAVRGHHWKIFYDGAISVIHYGGSSTRQVKPKMVSESHQSLIRFYKKHYRGKIPQLLYWLIEKAVLLNERRILRGLQQNSVETN